MVQGVVAFCPSLFTSVSDLVHSVSGRASTCNRPYGEWRRQAVDGDRTLVCDYGSLRGAALSDSSHRAGSE